jgi:hypothetical protein
MMLVELDIASCVNKFGAKRLWSSYCIFVLSWCADSEAFGGVWRTWWVDEDELWHRAIEISGRLGPSIAATSYSPASQGRARPAGAFCFSGVDAQELPVKSWAMADCTTPLGFIIPCASGEQNVRSRVAVLSSSLLPASSCDLARAN